MSSKQSEQPSPTRAKNIFHSVGHILWMSLNLLAIFLMLLADCCMWIDPTRWIVPSLLGIAFRQLLWLNVFFAFSWLLSHRRLWCLFSLLAILLSLHSIRATFAHSSASSDEAAHQLTVLTYNTHQMQGVKKVADNDIIRYVRESGADIVCLQEYEVSKRAGFLSFEAAKQALTATYPYTYFDFSVHNARRQYGLAVFSKYPLIHKQTIRYESKANISDYCDVVVDKDTFRLINNHLESNRFTRHDFPTEGDDWSDAAQHVADKMDVAYQRRVEEVKEVAETIRRSPYPVIVAGDFNDVPVSYTYHHLSRGLQDCALSAGLGRLNLTCFPRPFDKVNLSLGLRIDYILASQSFSVRSFRTDEVDYSDHRPSICTLAW